MSDDNLNTCVARIDERTKAMQESLEEMKELHVTRLNDHARRLSRLERLASFGKGIVAAVVLAAGTGASWVGLDKFFK